MALKDTLAQLRKDRGMTQEELAEKLFVTRQAVSRWETGETEPGIDMTKLLAVTLNVPVGVLLEMPEHFCQSCGMPVMNPTMRGTEADGSPSDDYCKYCYDKGAFTYETDMDNMIEGCAPYLMEATGYSRDEAVSLMGAMLPNLKRWKDPYEAEARERYGDEAVDASRKKLDEMTPDEWNVRELLEESIKAQLRLALANGDPTSEEAAELAHMHERWIRMSWGDGAYSREAHLGLAQGYLADERFTSYYDSASGEGATAFLVQALTANLS